jgi:hypothetical protein
VPFGHWSQLVALAFDTVPAPHSLQAVAGSESVSAVPAAQAPHFVEDAAAYSPAEHFLHAVAGLLS